MADLYLPDYDGRHSRPASKYGLNSSGNPLFLRIPSHERRVTKYESAGPWEGIWFDRNYYLDYFKEVKRTTAFIYGIKGVDRNVR